VWGEIEDGSRSATLMTDLRGEHECFVIVGPCLKQISRPLPTPSQPSTSDKVQATALVSAKLDLPPPPPPFTLPTAFIPQQPPTRSNQSTKLQNDNYPPNSRSYSSYSFIVTTEKHPPITETLTQHPRWRTHHQLCTVPKPSVPRVWASLVVGQALSLANLTFQVSSRPQAPTTALRRRSP
jgi:hypothetical protein